MATVTLTNKVPQKVGATDKTVIFTPKEGIYFGFGSTTPTTWFEADVAEKLYVINSEFGEQWLKFDLDKQGIDSNSTRTVSYEVSV